MNSTFLKFKIIVFLFIISAIFVSCNILEQAPVLPSVTDFEQSIRSEFISFKDNTFEKKIRDVINKSSGNITYKDISNIKELNFMGTGIDNIDDLKWFTSLESLELGNSIESINEDGDMAPQNDITDISILNELEHLAKLGLSGSCVQDITQIKNLTKLRSLNLSRNKLININFLDQ